MTDYNTLMVVPTDFGCIDEPSRRARFPRLLGPSPLALLEREYSKTTTTPSWIPSHVSSSSFYDTSPKALVEESMGCPSLIWAGGVETGPEGQLEDIPMDLHFLNDTSGAATNGYDEPSDSRIVSHHSSPCHSPNLYAPSLPPIDLVLQSLHQICSNTHTSQSTPWGEEKHSGQGLRLDQVLHMIDNTISSTSSPGWSTEGDFILLTLTSYPFRILYAPPQLKSMLQCNLVGEPLYKHLSPSNVLPTMSLADASSTPLPTTSIPCLLDEVFECHAEALPVMDPEKGSTLFHAIFVHEVQTPMDNIFPSDF
jgi:hypothetical protein